MAYTTPVNWSSGNVPTAAQLNTYWSDNLEYLYERQAGFPNLAMVHGYGTDNYHTRFVFRHTHDYLHWRIRALSGTLDGDDTYLRIYTLNNTLKGSQISILSGDLTGPDDGNATVQSGTEEIHTACSLSYGTYYYADFDLVASDNGEFDVCDCYESPESS